MYVIGSLEVGGTEKHLVQIARQLKYSGWAPEFFVLTRGGPLTETLREAGIPIFGSQLPAFATQVFGPRLLARISLVLTFLKLMFVLLRRRPAVTHFFLPAAYLLGGLAAILTFTRPRVMSRRGMNDYQASRPVYARAERLLHPYMDRVCGNSMAVMKQLAGEGIHRGRLRLIYNGIYTERFADITRRGDVREKLGIAHNALVLIMVANLIPYKGHADLINALSTVSDRLPDPWVCLLVGRDDGIGLDLKARADLAGLAPNLRWLGSRQDVQYLLAAADIGVLCSHEEGFSNAILEGMVAGLPMVVTDVGGNAEAVVDGVTGRVVSPRDPPRLADGILSVSMNPDRQLMGLRGRQRVEDMFSMTACVASYESLYKELLN